jgi:predicted lipoprotein with Yx(FWY)xxD motif
MITGRIVALGIALALLGAACGSAAAASGPSTHPAQVTVAVRNVPGVGTIYTDANGMALYTPAQETRGTIECTGACTNIWIPLAPPASGSPTQASGVRGTVGVIARPDGSKQVTLDGAPLYRFYQDTQAGTVNGNGISDSFGGVSFTWHVDSVGGTTTTTQGSVGNRYGN